MEAFSEECDSEELRNNFHLTFRWLFGKMFKNFLVKNPHKATNSIFSGKLEVANNPSIGTAYQTTRIFTQNKYEGRTTEKCLTKKISGPPSVVPAVPSSLRGQSGSGLDLEEVLEHPLKVTEEEFNELLKDSEGELPPPSPPSDLPSEEKSEAGPDLESGPSKPTKNEEDIVSQESNSLPKKVDTEKNELKRPRQQTQEGKPKRKRTKKYDFNLF